VSQSDHPAGTGCARRARLITGILDAIVDLEVIGDYAYEMVAISGSAEHRPSNPIMNQIREKVRGPANYCRLRSTDGVVKKLARDCP